MKTMKKYGLKYKRYDPRDSHFESQKILGALNPIALPDEYSCDNGSMPDQVRDMGYTECTAYTSTDSAKDHDGIDYSEDYSYMKALLVGGYAPSAQGCDLKSQYKGGCVFGLLPRSLSPISAKDHGQEYAATPSNWPAMLDQEAAKHRKPAYLGIGGDRDFFDNARAAMWLAREEKRAIGIGVTWFYEFETIGIDGICPDKPSQRAGGHAAKIAGWTKHDTRGELIRAGEIFLKIKSWQGPGYGDNGWCYFSRNLANSLMSEIGADARMFKMVSDGTVEELKQQKISFLEVLIALYKNLIVALKS